MYGGIALIHFKTLNQIPQTEIVSYGFKKKCHNPKFYDFIFSPGGVGKWTITLKLQDFSNVSSFITRKKKC